MGVITGLPNILGGLITNATSVDTTPAEIDATSEDQKGIDSNQLTLIITLIAGIAGFGLLTFALLKAK